MTDYVPKIEAIFCGAEWLWTCCIYGVCGLSVLDDDQTLANDYNTKLTSLAFSNEMVCTVSSNDLLVPAFHKCQRPWQMTIFV